MKKFVVVGALLVAAVIVAFANEEKPMPFSALRFECNAAGRGGKVVIEADQDDKTGLLALHVTAFGKDYVLSREKLTALSGVRWNGVRVTDDNGILGHTIWIQLQYGALDTMERVLIRVSRDGSIQLYKMDRKSSNHQPATDNALDPR